MPVLLGGWSGWLVSDFISPLSGVGSVGGFFSPVTKWLSSAHSPFGRGACVPGGLCDGVCSTALAIVMVFCLWLFVKIARRRWYILVDEAFLFLRYGSFALVQKRKLTGGPLRGGMTLLKEGGAGSLDLPSHERGSFCREVQAKFAAWGNSALWKHASSLQRTEIVPALCGGRSTTSLRMNAIFTLCTWTTHSPRDPRRRPSLAVVPPEPTK